jgi:hypothetical protein
VSRLAAALDAGASGDGRVSFLADRSTWTIASLWEVEATPEW